MFDNIGSKIKGLAVTVFVLGAISASLVGLFIMGAAGDGGGALAGLLIIAGGVVAAYVGSFRLYGYGQLIEDSDTMVKQLHRIEKLLQTSASEPARKTQAMPAATTAAVAKPAEKGEKPSGRSIGEPQVTHFAGARPQSGTFFCPNCGAKQKYDRTVCWNCETKLVFDGEDEQEEKPAAGEERVRCGKCNKEYFAPKGKDVACPHCGSTFKIFL